MPLLFVVNDFYALSIMPRNDRSVVETVGRNVKKVIGPARGERDSRGSPKRGGRENFEDVYDTSDFVVGIVILIFIFFVFSPGVLLTIPPGRGGLWMSCTTSLTAAFVHAALLVAVLSFI
jgi:hypothetical protein